MKAGCPTLREVLEDPVVVGAGDPIPEEAVRRCLQDTWRIRRDLLPVQILSGVGAWFATGFFLAFFGMARLFRQEELMVGIGIALLGFSTLLSRVNAKSTFVHQASLALGLTGNGLLWVGVAELVHGDELAGLLLSQLLVCLVFYPIFRSFTFRFLTPIALSVLAVLWAREDTIAWAFHVLVAIEIFVFGGLWLGRPRRPALLPLAYASACMLPVSLLMIELVHMDVWRDKMTVDLWPSTLLLALGLLWVYGRLAGSRAAMRRPEFVLAVVGTIALGAVTTPGVLAALGLLVVGRALGDRYLLALGYLFLPVFLFTYYFSLRVDLASKSWILVASGITLILIQQLLRWIERREDEGSKGAGGEASR